MENGNQKVNILLVDDNPSNLLALETILQAPDRNLVRASSGEEALRFMLDDDAAVILLDVHMPSISGLETAALIRGRERTRSVPIIFLTAYSAGDSSVSQGYSLGAVDYIIKPINPDALRSKVAVFVELYRKTEQIKRQADLLRRQNIELENANLQSLSQLYADLQRHASALEQEIADRKRAESERAEMLARAQAARAEAEEANRLKDEFLAIVSHELRTPLSAMLGWTEVLRSRLPGDPIYERALQTIERNAELQSKLIEDLLDTTRILSGKLSIETQPLQLDELLEESLDVVRPTAETKDIDLLITFNSAPGLILGDANRLQQVFWNLLSNAIKFTESGGRVEVRLERGKAEARVIISDTGKGITPDFLPYVFDPFRQADSSSARRQGGLGLGLALARRLVEMHGGEIKAESAGEGLGAAFTVTLPTLATPAGSCAVSKTNAIEIGGTIDAGEQPKLAGLIILVVDDEADARDLLAIRLQQYGAEVITAASAEAALEALRRRSPWPDLIVSDIAMPVEDGYNLIRRLRAMEPDEGGRIPAIALTAYSRTKDRVQALAAGFQMHMPKPVNAAELAIAITSIIGRFDS